MQKNIVDYVREYGDDSYSKRPFSPTDAFVFACIGFVKFEDRNIVPSFNEPDKKIYIHEIKEEDIDPICENEMYGEGTKALLRLMKEKNRYKDISLQYQFNVIDDVLTEQIYAITLNIPEVGYFIVFRGTDGTRIGWAENFRATINHTSAAQLDAIEYLNIVHNLIGENTPFMVGGHSKGGTLTLYSSIFVEQKIQDLIINSYFFEGPGLPYKYYEKEQYKRIKDRILQFVPRDSFFGELFYTPKNPKVIFCEGHGPVQHDQFHWLVQGPDFYYIKERNPNTRVIHRASKMWLKEGKKKDFENLIKIILTISYVDGNEDYISVQLSLKKIFKRYKEIKKQLNFKERMRFFRFAFHMYRIYKNSDKYYKKKDKENNRQIN